MTALSCIAYVVLNRNIHGSMYVEISKCAGNGQWYIFRFLQRVVLGTYILTFTYMYLEVSSILMYIGTLIKLLYN